jgi:glutamyl-tRNA synthetase
MNGQHLNLVTGAELAEVVTPALVAAGLATAAELEARRDWYLALLELLKVRARTIDDIVRQAAPYLRDDVDYDPEAEAKQWKDRPGTAELLAAVRETLGSLAEWQPAAMEEVLRALAERLGFGDKAGKIFQPLRVALTGLGVSPGIFDVLVMLGRERSLRRIDAAVARLAAPAGA